MVAWYSKSIIRSSSDSFFHWHPLTVCLMWRSRSAIVSDSSCLKSARYVSLKCQNEVDCSKLFSNAFRTCSTFLRSSTLSSRVSQWLYASSPPATSMRAHCLSSGTWSATKIPFIRHLKALHAATLSAALQFISRYFSLGTVRMISEIRRSFQDHEGKLNESYLSDN